MDRCRSSRLETPSWLFHGGQSNDAAQAARWKGVSTLMAAAQQKRFRAIAKYEAFWQEFGELVEPTLLAPPVSLADLATFVRTPEAEDFLRRTMLMSVADILDDFFESDEVKASLATSAVAVLYARDGRSLNYIVMPRPVSVSKARAVKAKLMRGCAELSRRGRRR